MHLNVVPKIASAALKDKDKAWNFEAKTIYPEAKAKVKAIKIGLKALQGTTPLASDHKTRRN